MAPLDAFLYGERSDVSTAGSDEPAHQSHQSVPFETWTVSLPNSYEICISDSINYGTHRPPSSLSFLAFPSLSGTGRGQGKAAHVHLSIDTQSTDTTMHNVDISTPFSVPTESYPELVQLGTTGRRAVWLEQSLGSDNVQLMRLDYSPTEMGVPRVNVLLPPDPGLPFKPSYCRALAFDEATGRLCLGLFSGELYILDYA